MYIIPEPKKMAEKSGTFSMNCQTRIVIASAVPNCQCDNIMDYMKLLKQEIFQSTGLNVPMLCAVPQDGDIVLFPDVLRQKTILCPSHQHGSNFTVMADAELCMLSKLYVRSYVSLEWFFPVWKSMMSRLILFVHFIMI